MPKVVKTSRSETQGHHKSAGNTSKPTTGRLLSVPTAPYAHQPDPNPLVTVPISGTQSTPVQVPIRDTIQGEPRRKKDMWVLLDDSGHAVGAKRNGLNRLMNVDGPVSVVCNEEKTPDLPLSPLHLRLGGLLEPTDVSPSSSSSATSSSRLKSSRRLPRINSSASPKTKITRSSVSPISQRIPRAILYPNIPAAEYSNKLRSSPFDDHLALKGKRLQPQASHLAPISPSRHTAALDFAPDMHEEAYTVPVASVFQPKLESPSPPTMIGDNLPGARSFDASTIQETSMAAHLVSENSNDATRQNLENKMPIDFVMYTFTPPRPRLPPTEKMRVTAALDPDAVGQDPRKHTFGRVYHKEKVPKFPTSKKSKRAPSSLTASASPTAGLPITSPNDCSEIPLLNVQSIASFVEGSSADVKRPYLDRSKLASGHYLEAERYALDVISDYSAYTLDDV